MEIGARHRRPDWTTRGRPQGGPEVIGARMSAGHDSTGMRGSWQTPSRCWQANAEQHSAGSSIDVARWIVVRRTRGISTTHAKPPRSFDASGPTLELTRGQPPQTGPLITHGMQS